jgi:hypothetical protein
VSANPKQRDQVWAKWQRWFDASSAEVVWLFLDRELFETLRDAIIEHGPKDTGTWLTHYGRLYAAKQVMGARRVMDTGKHAESFGRILVGMEASPQVFSRSAFMAPVSDRDKWAQDDRRRLFEKLRAPDGDWVNPELIRLLRETLEADVEKLDTFATRVIAHPDERRADLNWSELRVAIDVLGDTFREFGRVFRDIDYDFLPTVQDDWQSTFQRWLFGPYRDWGDPNLIIPQS